MAWAIYPPLRGFVLTMRDKGNARKTTVLFSMCRLDSCGRRSAENRDKVLGPLEKGNNLKAPNAVSHKVRPVRRAQAKDREKQVRMARARGGGGREQKQKQLQIATRSRDRNMDNTIYTQTMPIATHEDSTRTERSSKISTMTTRKRLRTKYRTVSQPEKTQ